MQASKKVAPKASKRLFKKAKELNLGQSFAINLADVLATMKAILAMHTVLVTPSHSESLRNGGPILGHR
ncbi:hypothetical protein KQX54_017815 [Cotesia glomerata]|uniref:Uncharacterized protein n=1 Tax=Cotesia glomerata TaxID=32391 RepID=A0AAV7J9Y7_COTGL|nr:hypothetical protein KQX54_017815 [Cotesia glomerata]